MAAEIVLPASGDKFNPGGLNCPRKPLIDAVGSSDILRNLDSHGGIEMRPLMATTLKVADGRPPIGQYDEASGLTVGLDGLPLALTAHEHETMTKVHRESADNHQAWAFETQTMTENAPADDQRTWAFETETRVPREPADDMRPWAPTLALGLPTSDDASTGLVSF